MRAVVAIIKRLYFQKLARELDTIEADAWVRTAQVLGDHAGVRAALKSNDVPKKVRSLVRQMQMVQQEIPCTDAYREGFHRKMVALRAWDGASSVYLR